MSANITITGRLGADPELTFSPSGTAVAKMRVVSSRSKKDESGEWVEIDTTWWAVTAFKAAAEQCVEQLRKGDSVLLIGTIKSRTWKDDKSGENRTVMEVIANQIGPDLSRPRKKSQSAGQPDPWAQSQEQEPPF